MTIIRTGLTGTDIGISYLLPRLVGASRAFDLIISGREVDAAEQIVASGAISPRTATGSETTA